MRGAPFSLVAIAACCGLLAIGCGHDAPPQDKPVKGDTVGSQDIAHGIHGGTGLPRVEFPEVDDNVRHDTLLIQVTFDLGDGTFIMVASNVDETFEGVRLYRYRLKRDGGPEIIAASSPGYDSWTMLPSFFPLDRKQPTDAMWLLANMGERESWGQKLIWLDWEFTDMGFMDVALPERVVEDDTLRLKRRNIGPNTRIEDRNDTSYFRFACDSVYLYDDQAGNMDQVLPAGKVFFTYHREEGLALWVNGEKRPVKKPA
ncbi:MAG: hypothetical protein JNL43_02665 [Flavobacteriales bacterium]|nr:hypothetical protein [Flavobacteriales bacterium]